MEITIINHQRRIRLNQKELIRIAGLVLKREKSLSKNISILVTTNSKIRRLNKRFLGKDISTDVLAFSFKDNKVKISPADFLGDVAVSVDMAIKNAKIYKVTPKKELYLYAIHGILHLLGYDDLTPRKRAVMRKKEEYYLQRCTSYQNTRTPVTRA